MLLGGSEMFALNISFYLIWLFLNVDCKRFFKGFKFEEILIDELFPPNTKTTTATTRLTTSTLNFRSAVAVKSNWIKNLAENRSSAAQVKQTALAVISLTDTVRASSRQVLSSNHTLSDKHNNYLQSANETLNYFLNNIDDNTTSDIKFEIGIVFFGGVLLTLLTVIGNALVLIAFINDNTLNQMIMNYWIISLSFTDLILAVVVMPLALLRDSSNGKWAYGKSLCEAFITIDILCCTCSIYHLFLISLDRYLCVRFPFTFPMKRTKRRMLIAILSTWVLCLVISSVRFVWPLGDKGDECAISSDAFIVFSSLFSFYVPFVLTVCMYLAIWRITRHQTNKLIKRESSQMRESDVQADPVAAPAAANKELQAVDIRPAIMFLNPMLTAQFSQEESPIRKMLLLALNDLEEEKRELQMAKIKNSTVIKNTFAELRQQGIGVPRCSRFSLSFFVPKSPSASASTNTNVSGSSNSLSSESSVRNKMRFHRFATSLRASLIGGGVDEVSRLLTRPRKSQATAAESQKSSLEKKLERQERKTRRTMMIILGIFVISWTPFFVINVISPLCGDLLNNPYVWIIATWLGYANSAVNPVIYTIFNFTFRKAILDIIFCGKPPEVITKLNSRRKVKKHGKKKSKPTRI